MNIDTIIGLANLVAQICGVIATVVCSRKHHEL